MDLSRFCYQYVKDFWVITAYYNPCGYKSRRYNYDQFSQAMKNSGIPLLTVECAFGDQPFNLPGEIDTVRLRSKSVIWQKERLLNLATSWLPKSCKYLAWIDCDLLFINLGWAKEVVDLLEEFPLIQLFETCHRLSEGNDIEQTQDVCRSFTSVTSKDSNILNLGHFEKHGHTGYGWATRREVLDRHGLYEYAIIGSGDQKQIRHFADWGQPFFETIQGRVGTVSGSVLHLWHGNLGNRRYLLRNRELTEHGFDPYSDLVALPGKPLEWRFDLGKPDLVSMFETYFVSRYEDGLVVATA